MSQINENNIKQYKTPFPSTKGLSEEEYLIDSHPALMDGAVYGCEHDYAFRESNLDFSKYSGIILDIYMGSILDFRDLNHSCFSIEKDFLQQDFFDELALSEKYKPKLSIEEHDDFHKEEAKKKRGETVSLDCTFYPISSFGRSLLYKVDVAVKIRPEFPIVAKKRATGEIMANFLQKYFIVDKEGIFFEQQAKNALTQCFQLIPGAFLATRDKKIYIVNYPNWMVTNTHKKAADYKSPLYYEPSAL